MKSKSLFSLVLLCASGLALAQQGGIGAIKIEPASVAPGKEVKITITAEGEAPTFCGMVVTYSDGSEARNVKIDSSEQKFPVSFGKSFAKPGTYTVKAEGKKITTHFPCIGKAEATVTVGGGTAAAAAPVKAAAPSCPEGWKMAGKPGKAGDYSCKGGKGAMAPKDPMPCAAGLEAYSDAKAMKMGCRKAKK